MPHTLNQSLLPSISGYALTEELYVGRRTAVYRGLADADDQARPVVIKVLRGSSTGLRPTPHPSFNELVRFRNQYIIAKNLPIPGIVKPLALVPWQQSYALVMEDVGGLALRDYLQTYGHLSVAQVLAIALQLADSLHHLSQQRVLHKDINPANILIHPSTHQIWLTDFSLASLLPKESQERQSPGALEGTLAYIAPEQTGRMNRGIDYRSDFYGLGVTLYELLTGALPFPPDDDPMELIHSHIAKMPVPPCEVSLAVPIPKPLSDIVLKLIAKNAEDRYQSTLGLKHDLAHCLNQWKDSGQIEPFDVGQRDVCDRFLIPEKLYGRETEVKTLLDAFEHVSKGTSELMLVTGLSGIGKTAVINEVHKPIVRQRGYFIEGKFDQFNRNSPFSAFVQALRSLMGQLLSESDAALAHWKTKILAAVGEQGQVLIEVIPNLALIIGPQPEVTELSGLAAQNRFNWLFSKFIQVFTTPDHPLVLFLDDLQWADSASLLLLKRLIAEAKMGALLVLGAYRDNEVSVAHPLMLTLDELRQSSTTLNTLTLASLQQNDIHQLVADSLHCSMEMATPLAQLVYHKTQGNPFFATQFLQGLQTDGWITFNAESGHWQCDLSNIRPLALTDNVLEFTVRRLQQLPKITQNALAMAACLGNQFQLDTLAMVCEQSPAELAQGLWPVLQAGLIIPGNEAYKFFQGIDDPLTAPEDPLTAPHEVRVTYRFLHDRVQQAAYEFIPESQRQQTHYQIGRFLLDYIPQEEQEDHLFEIVNQLNIGRGLISDVTEKHQLISLNYRAGIKAKSAIAHGMALDYFDIAIETLSAECWQQHYSLTLLLYENAAEAAYLAGNGARMEAIVKTVTTQANTCLDTVKTLQANMQYCLGKNQPLASIDIGRNLLKDLGIVLPEAPSMEDIQQALETFKPFAAKFSFDEIVALPTLTDPTQLAIISTLTLMVSPAMIATPNLFFLIALITTRFSLENGNSPYSPYGYSAYAILLKGVGRDIDTAYAWGALAERLLQTSNAIVWKNRVYQSNSVFIIHGKRHVEETLSILQQAYTIGLETGDFEFSAYSILIKCHHFYFLGRDLPAVRQVIIQTNEALSSLGQNLPLSWNQCFYQTVLKLSGDEDNFNPLDTVFLEAETYVNSKKAQGDAFGLCYFYFNQAHLRYLLGQYPQALEASELARQYFSGQAGMLTEVIFYFYDSLIRLAYAQGPDDTKMLAKVSENQQKMKLWADHAPMNFKHKYELVCAEERRLLSDRIAAMDYYDRAIEGAQANGYLQDQALANELAAKFYLDWGKEKIAAVYMQEAYGCYDQWGAKAKTDDLVARYQPLLQPILQQTTTIDPLATLHNIAPLNLSVHSSGHFVDQKNGQKNGSYAQSTAGSFNTTLDLATVFKSAQVLSESIDLTELLEKLLPMMLQTSGAERLALLLPNADNTWQVRGMASAETTQLVSESLAGHPHLPLQLIHYALRTQEILEVDGLASSLPVVDPYFQQYPCRSVLCLPLLHQSKFIGLLYLDHHSVAGLFSRDRIAILNVLCAQAAISLENALLNQALEQKLEVQTVQRQASETRFRNMVNNMPGVVFRIVIQADGTDFFPYVSPNCHALYGVTAEAVMSGEHSLRNFEHSEDSPFIARSLNELSQTLQPFDLEFRIVTPSGTLKWVHVIAHPSQLPDGVILWDGFVLDVSDRKKLEQDQAQLHESLALKSSAIEAADVGIAILNDGKYIYLNESHLSMLGYELHELVGESWEKLYNPEEIERFKQHNFPVLAQQGRWLGEAPARRKDGSSFPQEVSLCALEDNKMICICRDISDRKHYEQQLQTLSNKLELAIESAQIGIWDWNGNSNRLSWDQRMFEIYGVRPEAFQESYQDWANRVHPDDLAQYEAGKRVRTQNNEKGYTQEFRIFRPDNTIRYISSTAFIERDAQGQAIRMVGTNLDITDRKTAELALQASQSQFRRMTENVPGMIYRYILHPDGSDELTYVSSQIREIYELEPETVLQSTAPLWARIHPEDVAWLQDAVQMSAKTLQPFQVEHRLILPEKGLRWLQAMSRPERLDNGDVVWNGLNLDVSDRKQAEAQLQRTNEELVRATRMKDEFLANMSHELRTPLNAILGMTEGLQDEVFGDINEQQLKSLTTIEQSGSHLLALINEILDLAKIESGSIELEYSLVSVTHLCQSSLTFIRQQSVEKGIQLHLTTPWDLPAIRVDERRLRQVLINLLNNAVKFTPSGGSVTLKVALLPPAENHDQRTLSFAISDTGIGIAPNQLDHLFQPFVQIDSALNRQYEGTGLGLALVKRIVELHGGHVTVTSEVGVGSCFTIELPYDTAMPQGTPSPKAASAPSSRLSEREP